MLTGDKSRWVMGLARADDGWTTVKRDAKRGVSIYSRQGTADPNCSRCRTPRMWRCVAEIAASPEAVAALLMDVDQVQRWNPGVRTARLLERMDPDTDVTVYTSAPVAAGLISARDFVTARQRQVFVRPDSKDAQRDIFIYTVGCIHAAAPRVKGVVRGCTSPSGFLIEPLGAARSRVTWVVNSDAHVPLLVPRAIADSAFINLIRDVVAALRSALTARPHPKTTTLTPVPVDQTPTNSDQRRLATAASAVPSQTPHPRRRHPQ